MTKIYLSADELAGAFPTSLRHHALEAVSSFPAVRALGESFSVGVGTEHVTIPNRLHLDPTFIHVDSLTLLQKEMVDCLLTRHTDGFVRQRHLARIVGLSHTWIPPFVVQLAGEYVVEILNVIYQSLPALDTVVYREFLCHNPAFLALTGQRIASYWTAIIDTKGQKNMLASKFLSFSDHYSGQRKKSAFSAIVCY
jgi:hypothetical protein